MPAHVIEPSAEVAAAIQQAYARIEPERVFTGCKVAPEGARALVRIYSQERGQPRLLPPPYQIYRFDAVSGALNRPTTEEAARYAISHYK